MPEAAILKLEPEISILEQEINEIFRDMSKKSYHPFRPGKRKGCVNIILKMPNKACNI